MSTRCLGSGGDDEALVWVVWHGVYVGPACGGKWALWDSRAICVSDEVGAVFVGVGEHLVEIFIWI